MNLLTYLLTYLLSSMVAMKLFASLSFPDVFWNLWN